MVYLIMYKYNTHYNTHFAFGGKAEMRKYFKKTMAFALAVMFILSVCPTAFAESVITVDGITYVVGDSSAQVYKYSGTGGEITIASKVNGVPVTSIGNYAFAEEYGVTEDAKRITAVYVPDTVTSIGNKAFMECTKLQKVELSQSLTALGDAVFWECIALESVLVFSGAKTFGENVFSKCPKLTVYCEPGSVAETYAKSNKVATKPIYPTSVTVNKSSVTLGKGGKATVKATVSPKDAYLTDVYWVSENKSIATVGADGVITAGKFGKTVIHCYTPLGDAQAAVKVTVEVPKVSSITCEDRTLTGYTVKWSKVKNADGYCLQKYVNNQWKTVKTLTKTKYTFTNLDEGSSCKYRVRAYIKQDGKKVWGKWSEILTASTKAAGKVKGLKVSSCTSSSIKLKWNKATDADGYEVYRLNTKTNKYEKIKSTTKTTFTNENLTYATQYKYKVRAYMKEGGKKHYGKYSSVLTATAAPAKVKGVKASEATKTTLTVKWNKAKNASGYELYVTGANFKKTVTTTKTTYKLTGLTKNTKYTVKVRAYITLSNKKYYGAYSSSASLSTNYMPTSTADIVAEYNEAMSKTVKSPEFYATKNATVTADITSNNISDRYSLNTAKALVSDYTGSSVAAVDFENGADKLSAVKAPMFFTGNAAVKTLPVSAVKKATFKKDGSGYAVTLELGAESVEGNTLPKNNSIVSPMIDWKTITQEISSDATVKSISTQYTGTTVKVKINQFGKLDMITVTAPFTARIKGSINGKNCDVTVQGRKLFDYVITWW